MELKEHKPTLSICIPTWNRSKFLNESLKRLSVQISEIDAADVEIFISDNASTDSTQQIVEKYINDGVPISYQKNAENVGAARNFIQCILWSKGQYIWLLGDDDFLKDNALKIIINILKNQNYGLLHLYSFGNKDRSPVVIEDKKDFIRSVSYYITFMSGNIFNRDIVQEIKNPEQYIPTHLLQVPYYIEALCKHQYNVLVGSNLILLPPADGANNGGYNFFEVFVQHYLDMWKKGLLKYNIKGYYDFLRKDIFIHFLCAGIFRLLIQRKNRSKIYTGNNRKGWQTQGGWKILFHYYGDTTYFYYSFFTYPIIRCLAKVRSICGAL